MSRLYICTGTLVLIFFTLTQIENTEARGSNGLIKRCGNDAKEFLKWLCMDDTFNFPFPFHRVYIILRYRAPYKQLYPFQHQAATCCREGCSERGYHRMCRFHKMYQRCKKRSYQKMYGRRKRRLPVFCR